MDWQIFLQEPVKANQGFCLSGSTFQTQLQSEVKVEVKQLSCQRGRNQRAWKPPPRHNPRAETTTRTKTRQNRAGGLSLFRFHSSSDSCVLAFSSTGEKSAVATDWLLPIQVPSAWKWTTRYPTMHFTQSAVDESGSTAELTQTH